MDLTGDCVKYLEGLGTNKTCSHCERYESNGVGKNEAKYQTCKNYMAELEKKDTKK